MLRAVRSLKISVRDQRDHRISPSVTLVSRRNASSSDSPVRVRSVTGPSATSRPRSMTTTWSTVWATSASRWLDTRTVRPSAAMCPQQVAQPAHTRRVEPVRRLVQDEHLRFSQQRGGQPQPLSHPEGEPADPAAGGVGQADLLQHLVRPMVRQPGGAGHRPQMVPGAAAGMEARRLEQRSDDPGRLVEFGVAALLDGGPASVRGDEAQQHAQRRGLAGAVGAEEPGHRGAGDLEAEVVDGLDGAEALRQASTVMVAMVPVLLEPSGVRGDRRRWAGTPTSACGLDFVSPAEDETASASGCTGRHEAGLVSEHHQLGPVPGVELGQEMADVGLGGGRAHVEPLGDLGVRQAPGDQGQDLPLPVGQRSPAPRVGAAPERAGRRSVR